MRTNTKYIEVVSYNPDWPKMFEHEAALIKQALGNNYIKVHHIGSTSVERMSAKPKLDIIVVVKNNIQIVENLEKADFLYKGEWNIPMRWGFIKRNVIQVNLHVVENDHGFISLNLCFRNF